jgi:SAM-dependent methyltransferase
MRCAVNPICVSSFRAEKALSAHSRVQGCRATRNEMTRARLTAQVVDRVSFEVGSATEFPGGGFDLVCFFDCLHDMGEPLGACRHVRQTLAPEGTVVIVEPFANDRLEDNLTPVGRVYSAASTLICVPSSLAQEGAMALGPQAGEARMRAVVTSAGFTNFRRAAETPLHLVYEARA